MPIMPKRGKRKAATKQVVLAKVQRPLKKSVKNMYVFKRHGPKVEFRVKAGVLDTTLLTGYVSTGAGLAADPYFTNTYGCGGGHYFTLNQITTPSDFTALFDRYKILGVKVKVIPYINDAPVGGAQIIPTLTYAIDYDDSTTPSSENGLMQHQYVRSKRLDRPFSIYIKSPKQVLTSQDITGAVIGQGSTVNNWNDCAAPSIPHYGLKWWMSNIYSPASAQLGIRFQHTFYLGFKDPQ